MSATAEKINLAELRTTATLLSPATKMALVRQDALLALVEAVEAAQALCGKHATRWEWLSSKRKLDEALSRFEFGDTG